MTRSSIVVATVLLCCASVSNAEPTASAEGFIPVTGGQVWYRIEGTASGTPLLVLHGGPGFSSHYLSRLRVLADERPVIFYDQLGSGRSERPDDVSLWRMERFVSELSQVREALHLREVHLLGHSWGAQLAVDYLLTKPEGVKSVVLSSPSLSMRRWVLDANQLRKTLPQDLQDTMARHEKAGTTGSEEYQAATMAYYKRFLCRLDPWPKEVEDSFAAFSAQVYGTMWGPSEFYVTGNLADYDRTQQLRQIHLPMLFTAGRYDEATPATTRVFQQAAPGSKLVIFENSAHLAMVEETEEYVRTVREFIRDVDQQVH